MVQNLYCLLVTSTSNAALPDTWQTISLTQGQNCVFDGYVVDSDDEPVNISGSDIRFRVKRHVFSDGYAVIDKEGTVFSASAGHFQVELEQSDTLTLSPASYKYQIAYTSSTDQLNYILNGDFVLSYALGLSTDPVT